MHTDTGFRRIASVVFFAALPAIVVVAMFLVASSDDSLSVDFHNELYPEAKRLLDWENPFPDSHSELWRGHNLIWPPVAAFLVAPFTLLSPGAADWAVAIAGLLCFMLSLRIVGVRDWRVYGAFTLWPSVIGEIRVSHLTPVLCLLTALTWRYRDARALPGVAIGLATAIKFFLWPVGVWLAAGGRRGAAGVAALVAGASLLLVLPFTSIDNYVRTLLELGRTFDQESYSPFGFLAQIGVSDAAARGVTFVLGAALLVAVRPRRRTLGGVLAQGELRPRRGGRARPLADRLAGLLRRRGDRARRRPPASLRGLGRAARDVGAAQRGHRSGERLGKRARPRRVRDRLRRDRPRRASHRPRRRVRHSRCRRIARGEAGTTAGRRRSRAELDFGASPARRLTRIG